MLYAGSTPARPVRPKTLQLSVWVRAKGSACNGSLPCTVQGWLCPVPWTLRAGRCTYTTPKSPHLACVVSRKIQRATARRTPKLQGTQPLCHIRMFPRRSLVSLTRSILSHNSIDHAAVGGLSPSRFSNRDAVHSLPHSPHPLSADLCTGSL